MAVGRYDILRWTLGWHGTPTSTPSVNPTVPGVEYYDCDRRKHYYDKDRRKHYMAQDNRLHYHSRGTD